MDVFSRFAFESLTGEVADALRPVDLEAALCAVTEPASAKQTLHWGRNYLYVVDWPAPSGVREVVVKQFRHDSWRARLRRWQRGSKAKRSFEAARALAAAGLVTAEPVALIESRAPQAPAWYVSAVQPHDFELRYFLRARNAGSERESFPRVDGERLLDSLGRLARRLHDARIWHRDLTSGNVLVTWRGEAEPELALLDLNRARLDHRLTLGQRMRELGRMPIHRRADQERYLAAYWGRPARPLERALYRLGYEGFHAKQRWKPRLRAVPRKLSGLLFTRSSHAHIPPPPDGAAVRDRIVWDALSDQPHHHASKWSRLGVRLADTPAHLVEAAAVAAALPRIARRYRQLARELYRNPTEFSGLGVALRPWPRDPDGLLTELDALGVRRALLRLHPWADKHQDEETLARELQSRGYEVSFALPQVRELVKDPARWRAAVALLGERFSPNGARFQIGQAINRSKWGVWNLAEYRRLAEIAAEELRHHPGVELLGPAVIDFEYYQTAAALNLPRSRFHLDAVSALLYVDRRGAPENRQAGFDTVGKVVLLKAIAETARHASGRVWITETNWPLREGPHSPAGRAVSVDEETQADYLARYMILVLSTGLVERVFWWQPIAKGYGLVDVDAATGALRRRPAFWALAHLARRFEGMTALGPLAVSPSHRQYRFRDDLGREWRAAWALGERATMALESPVAEAFSRDGEPVTLPRPGAIELSPSPLYLRLA
jgi:tRNA A-37 threonylcarbamoyl transferase component Bud32